jgi:hypothetical protein
MARRSSQDEVAADEHRRHAGRRRPRRHEPHLEGHRRRSAQEAIPDEQRERFSAGLSDTQRRILDTIATLDALERPVTHTALAVWLGVHPKTKTLLEDLGKLRSRGYLDGTSLTEVGRRASLPRYKDKRDGDLIETLDDSSRAIAECVLQLGVVPTINDLASQLGMHPKTKSLLTDLGALRSRGILTQGWPLRPTDVFPGGAS